jgi:hypothetical protein
VVFGVIEPTRLPGTIVVSNVGVLGVVAAGGGTTILILAVSFPQARSLASTLKHKQTATIFNCWS